MPLSRFIIAPDGLSLHACSYGTAIGQGLPIVCLPGLARTGADFHVLATALAGENDRPRHVVTMDYRGRGLSQYDRNPANYNLGVELSDLLAVLTALSIERAVFIGTSRGGLLTMLLAGVRPAIIGGVVLNDIGPIIDTRGLVRIKGYVGKLPRPKDFKDAADMLRQQFSDQFPKLTADDWLAYAHRTFTEQDGDFAPNYDVNLAKALEGFDLSRPQPPLWGQFDGLPPVPILVIRGANSDILSAQTVAAMRARRPNLQALEVPDQGHAPLLDTPDVIASIGDFAGTCDDAPNHSGD